jgi:phenylalanyl-tRNA synthetase beta chain
MLATVAWINDYLDPPATDQEQADLLTQAGFPLEDREEVAGDVRQDFEMTSNRGDCTCHLGLAREIAAASNRRLIPPNVADAGTQPTSGDVAAFARVINECPEACPRYTARVIRGVEVKPSPESIAQRLRARGDIPRNNIVDATNFVLFELGQPTHVFDLDKLDGHTIIIRMARPGERFLPIGEDAREIELDGSELVIADASKPVALAGVKGGALTAVTDETTNILIEAATFDPVAVRHTSRRHTIASDSSFRFERWVSPAAVDSAAQRLVSLLLKTAGGTLCEGVLAEGQPLPTRHQVTMRTDRCRSLMGLPIEDDTMMGFLDRLGFEPTMAAGCITATVPVHRGDIEREVDLIEEVVRMHGFDDIPIPEEMRIRSASLPPNVECRRAISNVLVGAGLMQSITHTLVSQQAADAFLDEGQSAMQVQDACAGGDPCLRPSTLSSLLRVRKHNIDQGTHVLSLFEWGATFHLEGDVPQEHAQLGLLLDGGPDDLRPLRGLIERIATLLQGPDSKVEVDPANTRPWYRPGGCLRLNGATIGHFGRLAPATAKAFGLDHTLMAAELNLAPLLGDWPPQFEVKPLPAFPGIERDLSAIVLEDTAWQTIQDAIEALSLDHLEAIEFVTTWRGKGIAAEHKSLTLRLRFRASDRTLRNEAIDSLMPAVIDCLTQQFQAEIRE